MTLTKETCKDILLEMGFSTLKSNEKSGDLKAALDRRNIICKCKEKIVKEIREDKIVGNKSVKEVVK